MRCQPFLILLFSFFLLPLRANGSQDKRSDKQEVQAQKWHASLSDYLEKAKADSFLYVPQITADIDTVYEQRGVHINFTEAFAYHTLREHDVDDVKAQIRHALNLPKRKKLIITVDGLPLEQYVPVYYSTKKDKARINTPYKGSVNVRNASQPYTVDQGLAQRHIALWNSHGRYYKHTENCWKWQRAQMFTTVEDLFTSAYVLPFLLPMLEHAGANVYLPRERDVQTNEVIVDNNDDGFSVTGDASLTTGVGFCNHVLLDSSTMNPFTMGDYMTLGEGAVATWHVPVPASGNYAVYVSYVTSDDSSDEAAYDVHHSGGVTHFVVNQQMGGGTWIYLGNFFFDENKITKITLAGHEKGLVIADAVRLGGGMGSIPRGGKLSGVPRWQEAARYYLQYAGALDSITFNRHGDSIDYNDDFRSRARWVNYLEGGESIEPDLRKDAIIEGLNIPIDLALGIHTDAGHFPSLDTTVGTLAIYSTYDVAKARDFYYGKSRLSNRDLADVVQTQLVNDLRALHDKQWTKRELWDKMYSEATFAQCPSLLLELHSHANAQDMRYGLDPQFRFDVSRAMYKAILRFLSSYYQENYTVQPLPVANMAIVQQEGKTILRWDATVDMLEASAVPSAYVVYTRMGAHGWDNGILVSDNSFAINVTDGLLRSYKVTAVNDGGESFPSTVLSMARNDNAASTVLVVDGFTRVSAPFFMENGDSVGVAPWQDEGVAWNLDIATIGWQYNYNQRESWESDDVPGHGGSYMNLSDSIWVGNCFDNSYSHVAAIANLGFNVHSVSIGAVEHGLVDLSHYDAVDLAFGEQRSTVLPSGEVKYAIYSSQMMREIADYLERDDARLIISGAHIANDAFVDTVAALMEQRKRFVNHSLGFECGGQMKVGFDAIFLQDDTLAYNYNTNYSLQQYRVEHADVLSAVNDAKVEYTYRKDKGAVVFYSPSYKVVASGVPFESFKGNAKRELVMKHWLEYLFDE